MKIIKISVLVIIALLSCKTEVPTKFSEDVLNEEFTSLEGNTSITLRDILGSHKDKTIVIDVWATWCRDCIAGLPKLQKLQKQFPDVTFVFLSLDKKQDIWKTGIEKYNIKGEHYYIGDNWKTDFGKFVNLDWIPRYMVVDSEGNIKLFKAIKADDENLKKALKN